MMKKRLLSLALSLAMVLTMTPVLAGAAEDADNADNAEGVMPAPAPYTADDTGGGETTVPPSETEDDNDITEVGLDYRTNGLPQSDTTYKAGSGLVKFTLPASTDELPTLTLENAAMTGNIQLGADAVNIVVVGSNTVGQIVANDAKLNITGTGSLTAVALQAFSKGIYLKIDGDLILNGGVVGMIYGETDVTAASITMNGSHGVSTSGKTVKLTATIGDIQFHGESDATYFIGSGCSSVELTADDGSIICEGGELQSAANLRAGDDIAFTKTGYVAIVRSSLTAVSETGSIRIQNTNSSGYAIQSYDQTPQST